MAHLRSEARKGCDTEQTAPDDLRNVGHSPKEPHMKTFKRALPLLAIIATASLMGCASTSKSESTGQYIDDTAITAKVKTAIFEQPTLKSAEINVETFKGIVQLSGFVSSQAAANTAVATAQGVKGVTSVKNDMRLK
jgi:osmotically-inducible protein OsmY